MPTAAYPIAAVLAAVFAIAGSSKLRPASPLMGEFARFGYPGWACRTVGVLEVISAALLVIGMAAADHTGVAGAAALTAVMAGALATHLRVGDDAAKIAPVLVLLVLLAADLIIVLS